MSTLKKIADDLELIAVTFSKGERGGGEKDIPEGTRFIRVSDTFAKIITDKLHKYSKEIELLCEPPFKKGELETVFNKASKKNIAKENKKRSPIRRKP